jgi:hypothetical protein
MIRTFFAVFLLGILALQVPLGAQESAQEGEEKEKRSILMFGPEDRPKQFLPLPLFIQNPTLGTGFGLALTVMFKTDYDDPDSPFSLVTVPGFYTNSQSFFLGSFTILYMMENRLRVMGGAGYGQVNNVYEYDT